jgi:CAAX protease family protein
MLLAIGGPGGLPGTPDQADRLMGIAFSLMAGPGVSGLLLTGLVSGRPGLRDLRARLLRCRVGARWYAAALLTSPLLATAVEASSGYVAARRPARRDHQRPPALVR